MRHLFDTSSMAYFDCSADSRIETNFVKSYLRVTTVPTSA